MRAFKRVFALGYLGVVVLFVLGAFGLIGIGAIELWEAFDPRRTQALTERFNSVLKCVAMLTIALASLDLAETVVEEEFKREGHVSAAVRTRRVLARFLVVVVVSLSMESLVAVFQFVHDDPAKLPHAASIALGAAALLAAWGYFNRMSGATAGSDAPRHQAQPPA